MCALQYKLAVLESAAAVGNTFIRLLLISASQKTKLMQNGNGDYRWSSSTGVVRPDVPSPSIVRGVYNVRRPAAPPRPLLGPLL